MISKKVKANDITINYQEYPHEGETIIFLHFGFASLSVWNGAIPFFEGKYRLILPDYRGHGHSEKPKTGYHIDVMADDMVTLMNVLDVEEAHFVGSSLGAELSVSLAARYPDRVLSVTVEGSAMNNAYGPYGLKDLSDEEKEKEKGDLLKRFEAPRQVYDSPEEMLEKIKEHYEPRGFWNENVKKMAEYEVYKTEDGKYTGTLPSWVMLGYMKENYGITEFEDYYKNIKAPLLFLPGEKEWENEKMQHALTYFTSLVPSSQIVHVPGASHAYVWLFKPEEASEAVLEFLSKL